MNTLTRTKICGLTARGDALAAAEYGADAIGLVFYEQSSRCVSVAAAREITDAVGPFVTVVGLFVNADREYVQDVLRQVPLQVLQFHGSESPEYCEGFNRPYMKALKVSPDLDQSQSRDEAIARAREDILERASLYRGAQGILLDTLSTKGEGGTGEAFNWECVPESRDIHWILAGGLDTENVKRAIQVVRPYAVDVSSGVEMSKGVKDAEKIRLFINSVKAANQISCGK
ncbi:phosphoribosylanthranilate isomerase [Proteobacteria bacterium 005FR1]|nr:phosphoribosylanthranilate isomerase [Proteobacteria bacterium 005FR1]